jgi:hypothetical protein
LEILGHYGIRIQAETATNPETVSQTLQSALLERQSRLQELSKSTELSIAAQVAESINLADGESQTLMSALRAYSPYSTVHLTDSKVKQRLEHLDHEIEKLGDGIKRLDTDRLAKAEQARLSAALGASF